MGENSFRARFRTGDFRALSDPVLPLELMADPGGRWYVLGVLAVCKAVAEGGVYGRRGTQVTALLRELATDHAPLLLKNHAFGVGLERLARSNDDDGRAVTLLHIVAMQAPAISTPDCEQALAFWRDAATRIMSRLRPQPPGLRHTWTAVQRLP